MAYTTYTWSEIRERLAARWEKAPFWTPEEALLAFNEGLQVFNLLTGRFKDQETVALQANVYLYTCTTALVYRTRISYSSKPLTPSSLEDFNNGRPRWRTETVASGGDVPTVPTAWAPVSLRSFYIWPALTGAGSLLVDGVAATPVLVEDGDTLDLGVEHLNILLGYALHASSFKKGGPFFAQTFPYFQGFLAGCAEENDQLKTSQAYRRFMGLDNRGLKPMRGTPTLLDQQTGRQP